MEKWVVRNIPLAKIDEIGRVQLPSRLRQNMKLNKGDEFVAEDLGKDMIVLKKINIRLLLEDTVVKAKSVDLDKWRKKSKRRAISLPDRSSRYLLDNTVFIAALKCKWTKSTELRELTAIKIPEGIINMILRLKITFAIDPIECCQR